MSTDQELEAQISDLPETPSAFERTRQAVMRSVSDALLSLKRQQEPEFFEELEPDYGGMERQVVREHGKPRATIMPVDVLVPGANSSYRVITKGTEEPTLIVGSHDGRRSVLIVNTGQPALGGQGAIAASDAYIGFSENMQRDGFWLKADAGITVETTGQIWALDSGGGTLTVLSVIEGRVI